MRLVHEDRYQQRAIHPLYFQQPEPQKIIEHSNPWNGKLSTLKELGVLPKEILIPFDALDEAQEDQTIARNMVRNKLSNYAEPIPVSDIKNDLKFCPWLVCSNSTFAKQVSHAKTWEFEINSVEQAAEA